MMNSSYLYVDMLNGPYHQPYYMPLISSPLLPDALHMPYSLHAKCPYLLTWYMPIFLWYITCPLSPAIYLILWHTTWPLSPATLHAPYCVMHYKCLIPLIYMPWHDTCLFFSDTSHVPYPLPYLLFFYTLHDPYPLTYYMLLIRWQTIYPLSPNIVHIHYPLTHYIQIIIWHTNAPNLLTHCIPLYTLTHKMPLIF